MVCCTDYNDGGFSYSSFSSFLSRSETENGRFGVWRVSQSEKSRGEKKIVWEEGGPLNSEKKRIYFSPPFEIPQKQQAMRRMAAFALQPDRRKKKGNLQEIPPSQFREEEKTSKHHVLTHSPFLPATKMRPVFFLPPPPPLAACHRVCSPPPPPAPVSSRSPSFYPPRWLLWRQETQERGYMRKPGGIGPMLFRQKEGERRRAEGGREGDRRKKKKSVMGRKRKGSSTGFDT